MSFLVYVQILSIIAIAICIAKYATYLTEIRTIKLQKIEDFKVEDGFAIINYLIDTEFSFILELPFEGKDIKRITDFEGLLLDLTNSITSALNPTLIKNMSRHGISEEYIYEYITHSCTVKILNYMKETNTGIAKPQEDEED